MRPKDAAQRMAELVGRGWDQVKGSLYRNAFFLMMTSVIGNGLGFFFWVVVANRFQASDLGAAITLFSTLSFVAGLGSLGIGVGLIRYLPESTDKTALVNEGLTVSGLVTVALTIVFLFLVPVLVPNFAFALDPLYVVTILVCSLALGIAPVLDSAVIALRRADLQTIRYTMFAILKIPIAVGVFALFLTGRAGIFVSLTSSFLVSVVAASTLLVPRVIPGYRPKPDFRVDRIRPIFRFSLGNYVAGVIGSAGTMLPTVFIYTLLGPTAGPKNAAYFFIALAVAGLLFIIPGAVFTSFYAEASHKDIDRRRGERSAILFSLGLLIPAIVGAWAFAYPVLLIFSQDYAAQSVTPLRILTFASIPVVINGVLGTRVRVRKRTLPLIISGAIFSGVTLGLGWILLQNPNFGINGLAYAYVLGQVAITPYLWYVARGAYEEAVPTEPILGQPLE